MEQSSSVQTDALDALVSCDKANRLLRLKPYVPYERFAAAAEQAGIPPAGTNERGFLVWPARRLQEKRDEIARCVGQALAAPADGWMARLSAEFAEQYQALSGDLTEQAEQLGARLDRMTAGLQALNRRQEEMAGAVEALRPLLGAIEDLRTMLAAPPRQAPPPPAGEPEPAPAAIAAPVKSAAVAPKRHVGIVGLFKSQPENIEREFGEVFRLTILGPNDTGRLKSLRDCHKVFLIGRTTSGTHRDILKSVGQEAHYVAGIAELSKAMTRYYVEGQ